jgi:riboflavin kinase/FMN adenylyltransferase
LRILDQPALERENLRTPVVTVGNFDGVHLGHQAILRRVVERATESGVDALAVTFDPHPKVALHHGESPDRLTPPDERNRLIGETGISNLAILDPTPAFLSQSPEEFVRDFLVGTCRVSRIVEGPDFRFGAGGRGDLEFLLLLGSRHHFEVEAAPPALIHGRMVSSTMIRSLLRMGEVGRAAEALGRSYSIRGSVSKGEGIGRRIGFPTANLVSVDRAVPADGVYAVRVRTGDRDYQAVAGIGFRPTFGRRNRTVEIYLLDYTGSLYGEEMVVWFIQWIREEIEFPSAETLAERIQRDCEEARVILGGNNLAENGKG